MDTTLINTKVDLPIWQGLDTPLYVTDIIQETHDVYTFRFQGNPLCRFVYWPGQFCTLVLNINGKKVTTDGKTPLLDIAEEQDIDLDYGCRSGSCGVCKARLLTGKVDMETDEGLEQEEKDDGYILTCVATPLTDCTLDA